MSSNHTTRTITGAVATAAFVCVSGWWAAPSQATTDYSGGGSASTESYVVDPGKMVAQRKEEMARDFVIFARARIQYAAQQR